MSRYIDADNLKSIKSIQLADFNSIETIRDWIDRQPTADVRENVHATFVSELVKKEDWKGKMQSYYQPNSCSNCHTALTGKENFCPNCGADMREGREDVSSC